MEKKLRVQPHTPARGEVDWDKINSLTDEDIEEDARNDLENPPWTDEELKNAVWVDPDGKTAISIRLDSDVLLWFRSLGPGYQTRMNAVLRSFYTKSMLMEQAAAVKSASSTAPKRPNARKKSRSR
jgi:uncharacterized protein (DUF4415 family)